MLGKGWQKYLQCSDIFPSHMTRALDFFFNNFFILFLLLFIVLILFIVFIFTYLFFRCTFKLYELYKPDLTP